MNENTREFTGVWIPKEILLNDNLKPIDKLLYAEIASFGEKGCWKRSDELKKMLGVGTDAFQASCKRLRDLGFINEKRRFGRMYRWSTIGFQHRRENPIVDQLENPVDVQLENPFDVEQENPVVLLDNTIDNTSDNTIDNTVSENEFSLSERSSGVATEQGKDLVVVSLEGKKQASQRKHPSRPVDLYWEALCRVLRYDPDEASLQRGKLNKAIKDLKSVGATPEDILQRAPLYEVLYPDWAYTPTAIASHWASLTPDNARRSILKETTRERKNVAETQIRDLEHEQWIKSMQDRGLMDEEGNPIKQLKEGE